MRIISLVHIKIMSLPNELNCVSAVYKPSACNIYVYIYPGWQWAAVMTCRWVINTPPHLFLVNSPSQVASLTNTCHGHSPKVEPVPPTIRPFFLTNGRTPHAVSKLKKKNNIERLYILVHFAYRYRGEKKKEKKR